MRVGFGFDVHRLVEGRALVLGGVKIPYHLGLEGHSDADVLLHAIMDALLGAAGLGDIGVHFPPDESQWAGISSLQLLSLVSEKLNKTNWRINNIDAVIVAEEPRLRSFILRMEGKIAEMLRIPQDMVNIKATTTEGLGFTGRGEGIAAYVIAMLLKV